MYDTLSINWAKKLPENQLNNVCITKAITYLSNCFLRAPGMSILEEFVVLNLECSDFYNIK